MTEQQSKSWYKRWWGIIIAIIILPYFLIWFIWAKTSWQRTVKIAGSLALVALCIVYLGMYAGALNLGNSTQPTADNVAPHNRTISTAEPKPKTTTTTVATTAPKPTATTTTPAQPITPSPTPRPAPTHTVSYQWTLMSGHLSSSDMENIGISWHDPSSGEPELPPNNNILGAIQQIAGNGYIVTYNVAKVSNKDLYMGINNYDESDASINCTILVDNQIISSETAPPSGYADCSGNSYDSDSGT